MTLEKALDDARRASNEWRLRAIKAQEEVAKWIARCDQLGDQCMEASDRCMEALGVAAEERELANEWLAQLHDAKKRMQDVANELERVGLPGWAARLRP